MRIAPRGAQPNIGHAQQRRAQIGVHKGAAAFLRAERHAPLHITLARYHLEIIEKRFAAPTYHPAL